MRIDQRPPAEVTPTPSGAILILTALLVVADFEPGKRNPEPFYPFSGNTMLIISVKSWVAILLPDRLAPSLRL